MPTTTPISRKFATILSWPEGKHAEEVALTLLKAGFETYECQHLVKRETPCVIGRVDDDWAATRLPQLLLGGVNAVVFSQEQIESVPSPLLAKNLHAALGAPKPMYAVEAWRGPGTSLLMEEASLVIRATVSKSRSRIDSPARGLNGAAGAMVLGPEIAMAHALGSNGPQATRTTVHEAAEVIEIFRLDGTRIRINSEKFCFDVLGEEREWTDRANTDLLMLKLSEQAVNAEIDLNFRGFRGPAAMGHAMLDVGGSGVRINDGWPGFEFYARWRYLVQRVKCGLEP